jgi:hypothetical protein
MAPHFGSNPPSADVVPDWFLGGDRKRRLLTALAVSSERENWTARELATEARCGTATVYEVLRVLKHVEVVQPLSGARYRFAGETELGSAVREMLVALASFETTTTPRPPRGARRS